MALSRVRYLLSIVNKLGTFCWGDAGPTAGTALYRACRATEPRGRVSAHAGNDRFARYLPL